MKFGRIDAVRSKVITCVLLVFVVASQATGQYGQYGQYEQYDGQYDDDDMVEGPRVERMHPEVSSACLSANCLTQNSEGPVGAMWFGPRLGRRRRSQNAYGYSPKIQALRQIFGSSKFRFMPDHFGTKQSNQIQYTWPRSVDSDDKRQDGPFTPRLGRELEEVVNAYGMMRNLLSHIDEPTDKNNSDQQQPPPMFPPRLGRNLRNLLRRLQM